MKIITSSETAAHKRTSHTARTARRKEARNEPLTFVCVDGEGADIDGEHRYVLLGVGDDQVSDPHGLSWDQVFEFLYSRFRTGSVAYTGFFLGYDFTQWLRTLPEYQARRLLDSKERAKRKRRTGHQNRSLESAEIYFPVDLLGWEFDILGNKRLKIRPQGESRWMYICDTGGFFQKSFLSVIDPGQWKEPVVSQEEYDTIVAGKAHRSDASLDDDMRVYNRLENAVLSRVLGSLDSGFRELGIHLAPRQWFGPGQAAQAWLDGRAITSKELSAVAPREFLTAARESYFGGWFEIMAHGIIPGDTYEYDINSAYPYIISRLPCLAHGAYTRNADHVGNLSVTGDGADMEAPLSLVRARVWGKGCRASQEVLTNGNHYIGSMLHRDRLGNISRPLTTEGWYWAHELRAAYRAGAVSGYRVEDTWTYHPCDCLSPFREVQDIYDLRLRVGKKTPLGMACKLMPNSLYGKFAQSVGNPKFGNPVYASLITSWCRTMILNAIATHPEGRQDVLMVATDGIYFRTPHPDLVFSADLGAWEEARKRNLLLFKPGVYWDDETREGIRSGTAPVFKTRGISAAAFSSQVAHIDDQFTRLAAMQQVPGAWPDAEFTLGFSMTSAVQALARGKWDQAGAVHHDVPVRQSSDPSAKRTGWYWDGDILRSRPPKNIPYEASHPYEKRFGMEDPWSQESRDQWGITEDGTIMDLLREILE